MSDRRRNGSTAPMWWGIFLVLGFTFAAIVNYTWVEDPARPLPIAQTSHVTD